jgi:hypothetical protein
METSILHHSSAEALKHSANDCQLCLLAWNEWEEFDKESKTVYVRNPNNIHFTFRKFYHPEEDYLSLRFLVEGPRHVEFANSPVTLSSIVDNVSEAQILNFWAIPIDGTLFLILLRLLSA